MSKKQQNIPVQSLYDLANIKGRQKQLGGIQEQILQPQAGFSPYQAIGSLLSGLMQRKLTKQQTNLITQMQEQQQQSQSDLVGRIESIIGLNLSPEEKTKELVKLSLPAQQAGINLPQIVNMLRQTREKPGYKPLEEEDDDTLMRLRSTYLQKVDPITGSVVPESPEQQAIRLNYLGRIDNIIKERRGPGKKSVLAPKETAFPSKIPPRTTKMLLERKQGKQPVAKQPAKQPVKAQARQFPSVLTPQMPTKADLQGFGFTTKEADDYLKYLKGFK